MNNFQQGLVYVACPYAHRDPFIRNWRAEVASWYAADLLSNGVTPFSPLSHSVAIKRYVALPGKDWVEFDLQYLRLCVEMHVLELPDWDLSYGVAKEVDAANAVRIPLKYIPYTALQSMGDFPAFSS